MIFKWRFWGCCSQGEARHFCQSRHMDPLSQVFGLSSLLLAFTLNKGTLPLTNILSGAPPVPPTCDGDVNGAFSSRRVLSLQLQLIVLGSRASYSSNRSWVMRGLHLPHYEHGKPKALDVLGMRLRGDSAKESVETRLCRHGMGTEAKTPPASETCACVLLHSAKQSQWRAHKRCTLCRC